MSGDTTERLADINTELESWQTVLERSHEGIAASGDDGGAETVWLAARALKRIRSELEALEDDSREAGHAV